MVHHRIQKKNRNKLKFVDPFNRNADKLREDRMRGKNLEPKTLDYSEENEKLLKLSQESIPSSKRKRKKRSKNKLLDEITKAGFERRFRESTHHLLRRAVSGLGQEASDMMLLAKHCITEPNENSRENFERMERCSGNEGNVVGSWKKTDSIVEKRSSIARLETSQQQMKMISNCRMKRQQNPAKKADRFDKVLNAKEIIPFGSRVDAPPRFLSRPTKANLRDKMNPTFSLYDSRKQVTCDQKSQRQEASFGKQGLLEERNMVIEAYRNLRR